jgi:hypothetical protein
MIRTVRASLSFAFIVLGCSSGEPSANIQTSHECSDTECTVVVWMHNPGNDTFDITYEFTAQKFGVGKVGELKGSYTLVGRENLRLEERFPVSEKPNAVGVGAGVTRGS